MGVTTQGILLAGATGLVGRLTLRALLDDDGFAGMIFAPVRRELELHDPRLLAVRTEFGTAGAEAGIVDAIEAHLPKRVDAFVSCLGTTLRAAGSREAFIAVDRDLVLRLAQLAFDQGAQHAVLMSSVGASRQSGNFYLRVKGEVEDAMARIGFTRLDIIQPGLLIGAREQRRPAEALAQSLVPLANRALLGKLSRFRSIDADRVARAIVALLEQSSAGEVTYQYSGIQALTKHS